MKKIFVTSLISLSLLGTGCKKILDTKPQDFLTPDTYFTKADDATAALGATWQMLTKKEMYGGNYNYRMQTQDDAYTNLSNQFPANLGVDATFSLFSQRWNALYQTVQYLNILLTNLPRVPMDATQKGIIRGEALFLRGFMYYELVKDWGPVPLRLTPTSSPTDYNLANSPIKDVYTQVLKDLTEAETLVPTTATANYGGAGYAAKTTVEAILARVCLSMAGYPLNDASKYQDAKNWAQKVVDSKEHALNPDFTQVFKNYSQGVIDKKESLWEVDFNYITSNTAASGNIGYLDGIRNSNVGFGASVGQFNATKKLILSYGPYVGYKDLRRDWTVSPWAWKGDVSTADIDANRVYWASTQGLERYFSKFRIYLCPLPFAVAGQSPINWPIVRYSDVLLMLAEAENALNGPTPLAYSCINQVRERGWGKMMAGATNITEADEPAGLTKDQFLAEVQNERLRELAGEALRMQDLKRWGIFVSTIKSLTSEYYDKTTLPTESQTSQSSGRPYYVYVTVFPRVSDRDLLWPIPASELQYNKLARQNPGW